MTRKKTSPLNVLKLERKPVEEIVTELRELLEAAEKGDIRVLAFAVVKDGHHPGNFFMYDENRDWFMLVAGVARLFTRMNESD